MTENNVTPDELGLSPAQEEQGFRDLLQHATDKDAVIAAAKGRGIDLSVQTAVHSPNNPEAAEIERAWQALEPPSAPNEYKLRYENAAGMSPDELVSLNTELTTAYHASGIPISMAQGLTDALLDGAALYPKTDAAQSLYKMEQKAMLGKIMDVDTAIAKAAAIAKRMPAATFKKLTDQGTFHSAAAILQLVQIADTLEAREAHKVGKK